MQRPAHPLDSQSQFDIIEVRDGWGPGVWGESAKHSASHSESHSPSEYWGAGQTVCSTPSFAALYTHGSGTGLQVVSGRGDRVRRAQWSPLFQGWGPPPRGSKWDQRPCQSPETELKFRFSPVPLEAWRKLPSAGWGGGEGRDSRAPASPFPARQHPAQRPAQTRGAPSGRIPRSRRSHPAADPREWRTPRRSPKPGSVSDACAPVPRCPRRCPRSATSNFPTAAAPRSHPRFCPRPGPPGLSPAQGRGPAPAPSRAEAGLEVSGAQGEERAGGDAGCLVRWGSGAAGGRWTCRGGSHP